MRLAIEIDGDTLNARLACVEDVVTGPAVDRVDPVVAAGKEGEPMIVTALKCDAILAVTISDQLAVVAAHEQIIDSDSDSRDVLFVAGGKVRIVNYSASGREVSLDDVGAGGFFGELAAIDGASRSATVVALEDTIVASLAPTVTLWDAGEFLAADERSVEEKLADDIAFVRGILEDVDRLP